jgi:hypothetical protein
MAAVAYRFIRSDTLCELGLGTLFWIRSDTLCCDTFLEVSTDTFFDDVRLFWGLLDAIALGLFAMGGCAAGWETVGKSTYCNIEGT